jgi:hypothetical protein
MPNNILKMFVEKVLQLVKPFLANLHSTSSKNYSYVLNDSNLFAYVYKNTQNFTLISNPWK